MSRRTVAFTNEQRRKDQRREVRDTFVVIDGTTCKVSNMSLRSFHCVGYKNEVKAGDDLVIGDLLLEDNSRITMNAPAMVIRYNAESRVLVAVLVDISTANFNILERLMTMRSPVPPGGRSR